MQKSVEIELYFSKQAEVEAVPSLQYFDIGSRDAEIKRIVPMRENVLIFKEDGIFRLIGDNKNTFSIVH
jgi:hypothetical protein